MGVKNRILVAGVAAATLAVANDAGAAPRWVDRPITLPRLVFAGDVGIGVGHIRLPGPRNDVAGAGMNLEAGLGVTDNVELGLRTGVRFGDDGRTVRADGYGRTLFTETWGTNNSTVANPELRVRWRVYAGDVAEVALDARMFMPVEQRSSFGIMAGVPLAFHIGDIARIDTGAYLPIVFSDPAFSALSVPGYFWFQVSPKLWLGPMAALRFIDPGPGDHDSHLLVGFGLGYQVARVVDLKTQIFFPSINRDESARFVGAGFGVQIRIE